MRAGTRRRLARRRRLAGRRLRGIARTVGRLARGMVADDHHVDLAPRRDARQANLVADSHDALLPRLEISRADPWLSRRRFGIVDVGGVYVGHDLFVQVDRKLWAGKVGSGLNGSRQCLGPPYG